MTNTKGTKFPNGMYQHYPEGLLDSIEVPSFEETPIVSIAEINSELRTYFNTGATTSYEWRIHQLGQLKKLLMEREADIVKALNLDFKRPADVQLEIHSIMDEIVYAMENLKKWMKPKSLSPSWMFIMDTLSEVYVPLGVVLNISPWNYPVNLGLSPLVGAIASGNCMVLKPSEISSHSSAMFEKLFAEYLDTKAFKVINGGVAVATEVLKQRWDHILYTGNSQVAKIVMRAASEYLTPVTLELGGKNPTLVDTKSPYLDAICNRLISTKSLNWGQLCLSPDYLVVLRGETPKLVEKLKSIINKNYGTDYKNTELWVPMVNQTHTKRVARLIPTGDVPGEGEVVIGGNYDVDLRFIELTFVQNVDPHKSMLMQEEIFGPVVPIVEFDSWEDAFAYIQTQERPLGSYLYSSDSSLIEKFKNNVLSGTQAINDSAIQLLNLEMQFGGVGNSGMGGYHGYNSFKMFSHRKGILQRSLAMEFINKIRYTPVDQTIMLPAVFPYMFNVFQSHHWLAKLINFPIAAIRWVVYTVKAVIHVLLRY